MRWFLFALVVGLALAVEIGLRPLWTLPGGGGGGVAPSLLLIIAVYVGLSAPPMTVAWTCVVLGLLFDLTPRGMTPGGDEALLVGPGCLGFLFGGYVALQVRGMFFRSSPLTIAVMVGFVGIFVHLVIVAIVTARGIPWVPADPVVGWKAADQLYYRAGTLLYSAVVAIPLSFVLLRLDRSWGIGGGRDGGRPATRGGTASR